MRKYLEAIVSGRVQGVMYRDFTRREASKLNIVGTVENCSDGGVRIIAEAEEMNLQKFLEVLKKGPLFARVDDVVVRWSEPTKEFSNFEIVYHGLLDRL